MSKRLACYLDSVASMMLESRIEGNPEIKGVSNNSGKILPGYIFVAIEGAKNDGHLFIPDALSRGASVIVHSKPLAKMHDGVSYIRARNSYSVYAMLAELFFDYPSEKFKLAGVTGTNGKTTTAYILRELLRANGAECGLVSTVEYSYANVCIEGVRTTPDAFELQKLFRDMASAGCDNVVMEVSSHGLDQNRIGTARFDVGVFTNLTGDHLDYHKDMESYFKAKRRLFEERLADDAVAAINTDDPFGARLARDIDPEKLFSFGTGDACDCRISIRNQSADGTDAEFDFRGKKIAFHTNLIGLYNVRNIAGAFCAAIALGATSESIVGALGFKFVIPGRMEKILTPKGASCFIDYAHTDDALERALAVLRKLCKRSLIVVFGCGGDRDSSKRPRMGSVAAKFADIIILTNDNPRSESPDKIIDDIKKGIPAELNCLIEPERRKAICDAVELAGEGDVVLIAGKGHEQCQIINGRTEPFDDKNELKKACLK